MRAFRATYKDKSMTLEAKDSPANSLSDGNLYNISNLARGGAHTINGRRLRPAPRLQYRQTRTQTRTQMRMQPKVYQSASRLVGGRSMNRL